MSKESTVTPIGGLSWIVRETWDMFVANGVCVELIPPPHPANTMATIKSGPRHKIALRISSSFKRHAKNSERGLLLGRICACILVWAIIAGKEQLVQLRPPGQKDRWNVEDLLGKSFFWKLWDKRSRLSVETIDPMVSASPGVQAGVSDKAGVSDCLSVRHGIHSSRQKDLRADSPKVKPLRSPPLK